MLLHVGTRDATFAALLQRVIAENDDLNQKVLAERTGIPVATLNAWSVGRRAPGNSPATKARLRELAEHLPGVTVAELFEHIGQRVPGPLSPEAEQRVLEKYRQLSEERQRSVEHIIDALTTEQRAQASTKES